MSMKTRNPSVLLLGCSLLLACGSQASPEYVGEALLTLQGRVEIVDNQTEGPLRPALAFRTPTPFGGELHFLGVETSGEFPADFTLRVMEPPSQEVIDTVRESYEHDDDRRPPFPHAYLTAVTDDLPDVIDAEPSLNSGNNCGPDAPCEVRVNWCLNSSYDWWDEEDCYSEFLECPAGTLWLDDCTHVSSEGNPNVRDYPWKRLAGLSEDLRIIYLESALSADDPVAVAFDLPALDAGYHALEVLGPTEQELQDAEQCVIATKEVAIAEYNAEHGTAFTYEDTVVCGSDLNTPESCDGEMRGVIDAIIYLVALTDDGETREQQIARDLGCTVTAQTRRRVLTAEETEHISVRIAPDVRPSNAGSRGW